MLHSSEELDTGVERVNIRTNIKDGTANLTCAVRDYPLAIAFLDVMRLSSKCLLESSF